MQDDFFSENFSSWGQWPRWWAQLVTAGIGSLVTDTSHIIQACHSGYRQSLTQNQDTMETKGFILFTNCDTYTLYIWFNSYNIADCSLSVGLEIIAGPPLTLDQDSLYLIRLLAGLLLITRSWCLAHTMCLGSPAVRQKKFKEVHNNIEMNCLARAWVWDLLGQDWNWNDLLFKLNPADNFIFFLIFYADRV